MSPENAISAGAHAPSAAPTDVASPLYWADAVRTLAMFGVVLLHLAAVPNHNIASITAEWWWWANLYDASARMSVPLFIMLSGALLLTRPETTAREIWRRIFKIGLPLILWTLIYLGWRTYLRADDFTAAAIARHILNGMETPAYPHLWFLYIMLGLYLLIPVLRPFVAHASGATQLYFAGLWIFVTVLQPAFQGMAGYSISLSLPAASGFIGYFVIGAALHRHVPPRLPRRAFWACVVAFLVGLAVAVLGTFYLSRNGNRLDEYFYAPLTFNVIAMSISAFLIIRHVVTPFQTALGHKPVVRSVLTKTSALAFGIYLVHPIVIDSLDRWAGLSVDPLLHHPSWYLPTLAVLVFVLSAAASFLITRTPVLRWSVP